MKEETKIKVSHVAPREFFVGVDSLLSLIAHRYGNNLPDDLKKEALRLSMESRGIYDFKIPITVDEVAAAEERLAKNPPVLPPSLKYPEKILERIKKRQSQEDDYDDSEPPESCGTCGGDGMIEYMEGGPEVWGEDCPSEENHLVKCPNCRGSGLLKDCTTF